MKLSIKLAKRAARIKKWDNFHCPSRYKAQWIAVMKSWGIPFTDVTPPDFDAACVFRVPRVDRAVLHTAYHWFHKSPTYMDTYKEKFPEEVEL